MKKFKIEKSVKDELKKLKRGNKEDKIAYNQITYLNYYIKQLSVYITLSENPFSPDIDVFDDKGNKFEKLTFELIVEIHYRSNTSTGYKLKINNTREVLLLSNDNDKISIIGLDGSRDDRTYKDFNYKFFKNKDLKLLNKGFWKD